LDKGKVEDIQTPPKRWMYPTKGRVIVIRYMSSYLLRLSITTRHSGQQIDHWPSQVNS